MIKNVITLVLRIFIQTIANIFNNIILIKVNNSLKKLLLLFFLIFLYKYINKSKIEIWEPRPNWLNSIFNKGVINFIKFFNNKKINYYGDGFLSLCRDKKPFWLIKDKENLINIKLINSVIFLLL